MEDDDDEETASEAVDFSGAFPLVMLLLPEDAICQDGIPARVPPLLEEFNALDNRNDIPEGEDAIGDSTVGDDDEAAPIGEAGTSLGLRGRRDKSNDLRDLTSFCKSVMTPACESLLRSIIRGTNSFKVSTSALMFLNS